MTLSDSFLGKGLDWIDCLWRQDVLPLIANLKLAIGLLLAIALFSVAGTVIEQGQTLPYYQAHYPEAPALFGFLTWKLLLALGLDHVYRTWWFLALLVLFGASLTACTFTHQLPALRAARQWQFYRQPRQFEKLALSTDIVPSQLDTLTQLLQERRYRLFRDGDSLYGRKGIVGRIGPIVVHASMLIILAGAVMGSLTGWKAQEIVPSYATFQVQHFLDVGPWANLQPLRDWSVRVNSFWIDYTPDGQIDQFYSDLSVLDQASQEIDHKTIHVNEPLRYQGITFYQADWGIAAVRLRVNNSPLLELPMAPLKTGGEGRLWGTWVPTNLDFTEGVSLVARDLQGLLFVYDQQGHLAATVRPGMATEVGDVTLGIDEVIGSTGLQVKADPSIPLVYAGFGLLMVGVVMSYASHSQIWILETGNRCYIGGRTNRAQVAFERELLGLLDQLPRSC